VPGELTRLGKPRRKWAIDLATGPWVVHAFNWFVKDELNFTQIARKLRKENVPPPPRVPRWTRLAVRHLLTNRRYIGDWSYGWQESICRTRPATPGSSSGNSRGWFTELKSCAWSTRICSWPPSRRWRGTRAAAAASARVGRRSAPSAAPAAVVREAQP